MRRAGESPHSYKSSPASRSLVGHVGIPTRQDTHVFIIVVLFGLTEIRALIGTFVMVIMCFMKHIFTIFVLAGTSTANTFRPLLLQQFLLCSLFTWTVTLWLLCNTHTTAPRVTAYIAATRCTGITEEKQCGLPCWLWVRRSCVPLGRCRWRCFPAPSVLWQRPWLWWTSGGPDSKAWVLRSYWQAGRLAEQLHSGRLSGMDTPARGVQVRYSKSTSHLVIKSRPDMYNIFKCDQRMLQTCISSSIRL